MVSECKTCGSECVGEYCRTCWYATQRGENNSRYKGRYVSSGGYVLIRKPGHPNAQASGWILEHVLIMAEHIKRPLLKHENVHHINGNKQDNRIENLELWSSMQPSGQRVEDKVRWAKEILAIYDSI